MPTPQQRHIVSFFTRSAAVMMARSDVYSAVVAMILMLRLQSYDMILRDIDNDDDERHATLLIMITRLRVVKDVDAAIAATYLC